MVLQAHAQNQLDRESLKPEVLKRLNTKRNFVEDIIKQKLKYAGHIIRGSAGEVPLLVLEGMIPGRRE